MESAWIAVKAFLAGYFFTLRTVCTSKSCLGEGWSYFSDVKENEEMLKRAKTPLNTGNNSEVFFQKHGVSGCEERDVRCDRSGCAIEKFENDAKVGDFLIVKVKKCDIVGAYVKPLCYATRLKRDLEWLKLQAPPLALSELPEYFRNGRDMSPRKKYRDYIEESGIVNNPYLSEALRFPTVSKHSFLQLPGLDEDRAEPASALRRKQNEMLADEYVVRGVEQMKSGNREAAIATLNQALEINPQCVEALVARGAAYSTNGHYLLAEADFDLALSLAPTHPNARNYMVENLVKHASLLEVQGDIETARRKFEKVLQLKEDRRARSALAKLEKRKRSPSVEIVDEEKERSKPKRRTREDADEERRKRRRTLEEERERRREIHDNREKLREMEEFIKALREKKFCGMSCPSHRLHTGRCMCIHSSLQCVDLAMQSLLLNHGLLPCPLSLIPEKPPPGVAKTLKGIERVRDVLRGVFRSQYRRSIREVAICVGPNIHVIHHAYKVPVSICDAEDSHNEGCGSPCSELSDVEKRRINRQLFIAFPPEHARTSNQRMYVYIRGCDHLVRDDLEESDVFFRPDNCQLVDFGHEGCTPLAVDTADEFIRWLRVVPFITHGKI